jgi:peroxiredoxin
MAKMYNVTSQSDRTVVFDALQAQYPEGPFDLDEAAADIDKLLPMFRTQDDIDRMNRANDELVASNPMERAAQVGTKAPDFTLPDAVGNDVSLREQVAKGPVVLSFYRGAWCPFCNLELRAYQQALPQIRELGATLLAISPQVPDHSLSLVERHRLEFAVLSDVGSTVARSYGLAFRIPDYLADLYERGGHRLSDFNGTDDNLLPIPATFVLDTDGIITFRAGEPNYTRRPSIEAVLQAVREISAKDGRTDRP